MSPIFAVIDAPIIAVIVVAAIILFGAERLPKLARSMGQAKKEFDSALSAKQAQTDQQPSAAPAPSSTTPTSPADPSATAPPPS
jgi:sec-independent protein translocase protein TatA